MLGFTAWFRVQGFSEIENFGPLQAQGLASGTSGHSDLLQGGRGERGVEIGIFDCLKWVPTLLNL